jgi:hypothetical protein
MPINAKNKPGCPCCQCQCENGELYPKFTRIKVVISGLQASYDFVSQYQFIGGTTKREGTVTGLDALNGSHFFDIDHTEENCIYDDPENPVQSQGSVDFEIYYDYEDESFLTNCTPVGTTTGSLIGTATIGLGKIAASYFLATIVVNDFTDTQLRGCQAVACENDFNPTQNGSFSPIPANILPDGPATTDQYCSNGKIWLSVEDGPFSGNDGDSIYCSSATVVGADYIEAGTITVELLA